MVLQSLVRGASARLIAAGVPEAEAALDAELLARHALGWDRATYVARGREEAPDGLAARLDALVGRRATREPVAYIVGAQEFWGRTFTVGPDVLIPRPETELIVEEALAWAPGHAPPHVLDIGTGSGCLAVTLALELSGARVDATDVSRPALAIAGRNAERLGAPVAWHEGPFIASALPPFDLIVSNPPYVADADYGGLQPEVRDFEPRTALVGGGPGGLDIVWGVVRAAAAALAPGGRLLMEIGLGQAEAVARCVADTEGIELLRIRDDLQGIPRVVVVTRAAVPATSSE
ncbi:MAG: peptide chain release factor N(5)-glutamine methyltransferase [Vicinamibacterales bacterium]